VLASSAIVGRGVGTRTAGSLQDAPERMLERLVLQSVVDDVEDVLPAALLFGEAFGEFSLQLLLFQSLPIKKNCTCVGRRVARDNTFN
jgi:hypothetical protein